MIRCDINREAAKISAFYKLQTNKYYLVIKQQKFTYFPLGKASEKQIKPIEDQGEKPIKTIQNQGQVKTIKKYTYNDKDSLSILKQKEIFNKLADERLEEISELDKKVGSDNLIYRYHC